MPDAENTARKLTALSRLDVAALLSKTAGKQVDIALLEEDITAGAPVNADGTINLVIYAAWLVKELAGRGD